MQAARSHEELFIEFGIWLPRRILYLGSWSNEEEDESAGARSECGVGWQQARNFIPALLLMDRTSDKEIEVHMNTPGGDWHHGMAMFNAIEACRSHVTIIAYGEARSMSSIILQAADEAVLMPDTTVMIHDGHDVVMGIPTSVEAWAAFGKRVIRPRMYRIYQEAMARRGAKMSVRQIEKLCSHDTLFTAAEAVERGLADRVLEGGS